MNQKLYYFNQESKLEVEVNSEYWEYEAYERESWIQAMNESGIYEKVSLFCLLLCLYFSTFDLACLRSCFLHFYMGIWHLLGTIQVNVNSFDIIKIHTVFIMFI